MKTLTRMILFCCWLLAACSPTPSAAPTAVPPILTRTAGLTDTPFPDNTITPSPTDAGCFEINKDFLLLQQGNPNPAFILDPADSRDLPDNHIGVWFEAYDRYFDADFVFNNGFKRMRIGGLFGSDQSEWPIRGDTLSQDVDEIITRYAENGVTIVLTTNMGSGVWGIVDEFTQEDINIILDYISFIAGHFKGRIAYYEIWNEFGNTPKINTYASLVEQAAQRIKEIDPDAKVIIGAVPGDWLNDQPGYGEHQRFVLNSNHLFELIRAIDFDRVPVDGISWHPLYDNIPEDPYYQDYPALVREVQAAASSRGFTGEFFADEILWHTYDEENYDNGPPVSKQISAKYYLRTITEHRGLDVNVTINTFFQTPVMSAIHNLNTLLAGAQPVEMSISLETDRELEYLRTYSFSLPGGDLLVAVWNNGAAREEDPGVRSTLTLSGFSPDRITAIDVYYGFEQELTADTNNNDLVIPGLLIKDYPIFIKLTAESP